MYALLALILTGCQTPPPIPGTLDRTGDTLTTVNGQAITQGMVDGLLAQYPADARDKMIAQGQQSKIKDDLVTMELLYQESLKQKLQDKNDVKMAIAYAERQAMARALLEQVVTQRTTDDQIKKWYDDHAVQFRRPQALIRHILVKDEAKAQELLTQLKGGAKFEELAQANSLDVRTAKEGGSMGWVDVKNLTPEVGTAIGSAEKGALVGPVASKGGFHVIFVEDKRDMVPLEEVKDTIKPRLREDIFNAYMDELKKAATITAPDGSAGASVAPAASGPGGAAPAGAPAGGAAPAAHPIPAPAGK